METIRHLKTHPTAAELYETVRKTLPNISLGTVYRNLELLAQMGLVGKIETEHSKVRYDGDTEPHYHIRCQQCGRLENVYMPPEGFINDTIRNLEGFTVVDHTLEFVGICPECKESKECA